MAQSASGGKTAFARPNLRGPGASILAMDSFAALVALLCLDRKSCDWARVEPFQADGFARFLVIAVGAGVKPVERGMDFRNQLGLPVARAQLDGAVGFRRRAVGEVRMVLIFPLQRDERFLAFPQYLFFPGHQLAPKIIP